MRLALIALIASYASLARAVERVESITLHLTRGPRMCRTTDVVIHRTENGYSDGTHSFATADVQLVVRLALAPPVKSFEPERVGLTMERVRAVVRKVDQDYYAPSAWKKWVLDPTHFIELLTKYSRGPILLDCGCWGSTSLDIVFDGGRTASLQEGYSGVYGLPWSIEAGSQKWETFDPDLARAVARLVAEPDQLHLDGLDEAIRDAMDSRIVGGGMGYLLLEGRFDSEDVRTGVAVGLNQHGERGWSARVSSSDSPAFAFSLFLREDGDFYTRPDSFLRDAPELMRRAQVLPTSKSKTLIYYEDAAPLTRAAQVDVVAAVKKSAPASAARVEASIGGSFAAERDGQTWIVLPDGSYFRYFGECSPGPTCPPIGQIVKP